MPAETLITSPAPTSAETALHLLAEGLRQADYDTLESREQQIFLAHLQATIDVWNARWSRGVGRRS